MAKSAGISKLVDETAVSSIKPWKSQFYINFIFSLHKFSNSILVNYSCTKWNLKWNRQWIWEFRQSKSGCLCIRQKVHFKGKIEPSFKIENLVAFSSIFHNFRNRVSFSLHFWITQWMLQPLVTLREIYWGY